MIGKGMQRFLVDTSRMMSRDHRQHIPTAPTCWRTLPCEPVLARLLATKNRELFHGELGRANGSAEDPMGVIEDR